MDYFLGKFKPTSLTQETEKLNRKIILEKFLEVIKYLHLKRHQEQTLFIDAFHQNFTDQAIPMLHKLFHIEIWKASQFMRLA